MEHILLISVLIYIKLMCAVNIVHCMGFVEEKQCRWSEFWSKGKAIYLSICDHVFIIVRCFRILFTIKISFGFFCCSELAIEWIVLLDFGVGAVCTLASVISLNRNRVDGVSPRTINIFAINFLILSVWSFSRTFCAFRYIETSIAYQQLQLVNIATC